MKKIVVLLLSYIFLYTSAFASMCEVKSFEEFFAKNLDIIVPSDSDNTPNSIRIKKSIFHYFIVGRDLPVEVKKDGKVIDLNEKEISKYIWGVERRSPEKHELNVKNCVAKVELENIEKGFKVWRSKNMSALGNAIHELDLVSVARSIARKKVYNRDGELDFRAVRMIIRVKWEDAITDLFSEKLKISKKVEPRLIEMSIELNHPDLMEYLQTHGADFDQVLFNGLKPLGYSLIRTNHRISHILVETGRSIFDVDSFGNSNGVYQFLEDNIYSDQSGCWIYVPANKIISPMAKRLSLKKIPPFVKWKDQGCLKEFKSSAKSHGIEIPVFPEKNITDLAEYRDIARTAEELDKKHEPANEFKHNLTDEEYKWRSFVKQAYGISVKIKDLHLDRGFDPRTAEGKQIMDQNKYYSNLKREVLIRDPSTGRKFCKLDTIWRLIVELGRKLSFSGECPDWKAGDSIYSKLLAAELHEKYAEQISDQLLNGKLSNELMKEYFLHTVPANDYASNVYRSLSSKLLSSKVLDQEKLKNLMIQLVMKGYLENITSLSRPLEHDTYFRKFFNEFFNSQNWKDEFDHNVRLYIMVYLEIFKQSTIATDQFILTSKKINLTNGQEYYLCGRHNDVVGYDRNKKVISESLPFCLKNVESMTEDMEGETNLPSGIIYNVDEEFIALAMDEIENHQASLENQKFYQRLKSLDEEIDFSRFGKVVFFKREEVTTPYVLTDGKITLGLPGLHVFSVKIQDRRFIIQKGDACSGKGINPSIEVIPISAEGNSDNDSHLNSKFYLLPGEFEVDKSQIINQLPIDQSDEASCIYC